MRGAMIAGEKRQAMFPESRQARTPWLADLLLLLALVALSGKMSYHISRVCDLRLADEAGYMYWGSLIPKQGLPAAESSPLYCLWYYLLSLEVIPQAIK